MEQPKDYEKALQELLNLISGRGFFGPGITTYAVDDPQHKPLHEACLELERRGKIIRHLDDGDMVVWKPREESNGGDILVYETSRPVNFPRGQVYELKLPHGVDGK